MSVTGLVILEGPDGAGKTTLAQSLAEQFGGIYVHRTYSPTMDIWEHHAEAYQIAQARAHEQLVIVDRLWPSELIYGRVFRGKGYYGPYNARSMDRVSLRFCAIHVLCIPDDIEYIVKTHAEKKAKGLEMFDTVREVAVRYVDWARGSVIRPHDGDLVEQMSSYGGFLGLRNDWFHYDVLRDGKDMKKVGKRLVEKLTDRQSKQLSLAREPAHPNFLGYIPEATHLFVGEALGDPNGWSKWPFFGRDKSADFLNRSLHQIAWPEQNGVWTNAEDPDYNLTRICSAKPTLKVIALGQKAHDRCIKEGIHHVTIPHPQWSRRFDYEGKIKGPYHELLEKAIKE
jgi:hypothetical protein